MRALRLLLALPLALRPEVAAACATCLASPWGDRTYNWAFLGLLLMPFALTAAIGGVLAYVYYVRPRLDKQQPKETT